MSSSHVPWGTIEFDPPLSHAEVHDPRWERLHDVEFLVTAFETTTPDAVEIHVTACAIGPTEGEKWGRRVEEDLQLIANVLPGRTFTGYIHCQFEAGTFDEDDPPCERYYIRDGEVVTVQPELVWPDEPEEAVETSAPSRHPTTGELLRLAQSTRNPLVLKDMSLDERMQWLEKFRAVFGKIPVGQGGPTQAELLTDARALARALREAIVNTSAWDNDPAFEEFGYDQMPGWMFGRNDGPVLWDSGDE